MKKRTAHTQKMDPMTVVVVLAFSLFTGVVGYLIGQASLVGALVAR